MFSLTKNDCIQENRWILKLFVGFLKKERLLYKHDISFKLYSYLKFNEDLNNLWFFENILTFLYLFVIPKNELIESLRGYNDEHRINIQLWKFYLLDHFDEIKFIKEIKKDIFKQSLIDSIYIGGVFDNEKLTNLLSKHKLEK